MLSKAAIEKAVAASEVQIIPFDARQLKPSSYVLTLGFRFRRWKATTTPLRLWDKQNSEAMEAPFHSPTLVLDPGAFILASTAELVAIGPSYAAQISPLSHVARFGLGVTCGADLISPGYGFGSPSHLTLELFNHNHTPLELQAGMPIAHLRVSTLEGELSQLETGVYEGRDPLTVPLLYEEWSKLRKASTP